MFILQCCQTTYNVHTSTVFTGPINVSELWLVWWSAGSGIAKLRASILNGVSQSQRVNVRWGFCHTLPSLEASILRWWHEVRCTNARSGCYAHVLWTVTHTYMHTRTTCACACLTATAKHSTDYTRTHRHTHIRTTAGIPTLK